MPERLGDYQLVEPLGRGGMGVVYRAWHTRLGQVRALKVLRPDRAGDRRAIERFQREITTLGGLEHPNLVRAFDAREEAGVIFLVMEFVEGLDLWRLLARTGPLPVSDSCEVVRQAAIGLEYAHRTRGMVHRDIKPSNLMITPDGVRQGPRPGNRPYRPGRPGAAGTGGAPLTDVDERVGTYDYMAPEQWLLSRRRRHPDGCLRAGMHPLRAPGRSRALCPARNGRAARRRCWPTRWSRRHRSASCGPRCRPRWPPSSSGCWRSLAAIGTRPPADVARALEPFAMGHDLPSLLPPDRFVPTVAGFAEPSVTDRTAEGATAPFHVTPSRWRPRWDWSRPPRFSKPIAIPAVLTFMTVLLLAHTIWNCWQRLDPDPTRIQGNVQETPATVHDDGGSHGRPGPRDSEYQALSHRQGTR